jgi:hypothetical protein
MHPSEGKKDEKASKMTCPSPPQTPFDHGGIGRVHRRSFSPPSHARGPFVCTAGFPTAAHAPLMSAVQTAPLWPTYVPTRSPLSAYHSVGWWSFASVKTRSPSLLYRMNVRGLVRTAGYRVEEAGGGGGRASEGRAVKEGVYVWRRLANAAAAAAPPPPTSTGTSSTLFHPPRLKMRGELRESERVGDDDLFAPV